MIAEPLSHNQKRDLEWVIFMELQKGYEGTDRTIGLRDAVTKWIEFGFRQETGTCQPHADPDGPNERDIVKEVCRDLN